MPSPHYSRRLRHGATGSGFPTLLCPYAASPPRSWLSSVRRHEEEAAGRGSDGREGKAAAAKMSEGDRGRATVESLEH